MSSKKSKSEIVLPSRGSSELSSLLAPAGTAANYGDDNFSRAESTSLIADPSSDIGLNTDPMTATNLQEGRGLSQEESKKTVDVGDSKNDKATQATPDPYKEDEDKADVQCCFGLNLPKPVANTVKKLPKGIVAMASPFIAGVTGHLGSMLTIGLGAIGICAMQEEQTQQRKILDSHTVILGTHTVLLEKLCKKFDIE